MADRPLQVQAQPGLWPPTWPMGLTMLRLLLLPVFIWSILENSREPDRAHWWVAISIFVLMAITDKLDGYLARKLGQTSRLGAVLDPIADKLLVGCAVILLSFDWVAPPGFRIPWWVVVAVYGKDLIIALGTIALLSVVRKVTISARPLGKASTVVQLSMVIAVLLAPAESSSWAGFWHEFVVGLWWLVVLLAAASCIDYMVLGIRQAAAGRLDAASPASAVEQEPPQGGAA